MVPDETVAKLAALLLRRSGRSLTLPSGTTGAANCWRFVCVQSIAICS